MPQEEYILVPTSALHRSPSGGLRLAAPQPPGRGGRPNGLGQAVGVYTPGAQVRQQLSFRFDNTRFLPAIVVFVCTSTENWRIVYSIRTRAIAVTTAGMDGG